MGQQIRAICQRHVNGQWRHLLHIPSSPIRDYWFGKMHYRWLAYDGFMMADGSVEWDEEEDDFTIARTRGYPEDFDDHQWEAVKFFDPAINDEPEEVELPWDEGAQSWLSLDELVNHDYDRIVTDFGVTKPLREFLGERFIQFWKDAQAAGAERVVFSIS